MGPEMKRTAGDDSNGPDDIMVKMTILTTIYYNKLHERKQGEV